ncbi:MAG: hypothetical protein Q9172_006534 [Xanthocarpia lactea]
MAAINSALDLVTVCLPLPVISKLHMNTKRKWAVGGVFMFGGLCASIIAACLPTLAPLFRGNWQLDTIVRSARSMLSLRSKSSKISTYQEKPNGNKQPDHQAASRDAWLELSSNPSYSNFVCGGKNLDVENEGNLFTSARTIQRPGLPTFGLHKMAESNADDTYVLKRDFTASTCLNCQHYMWQQELRFTLHPSIPEPASGAAIADVAAGTGVWLIEVAKQYPLVDCLGLDISTTQSPPKAWLPSNIDFKIWDFTEKPPARGYLQWEKMDLDQTVIPDTTPDSLEDQTLKRDIEDAVGNELRETFYAPQYRMARQLFDIALDGIRTNVAFEEAHELMKEWAEFQSGLTSSSPKTEIALSALHLINIYDGVAESAV